VRWNHIRAIAGADLRRLFKSKDYWIPLLIMASLFFVIIPLIMLTVIARLEHTPFVDQVTSIVGNLPARLNEVARGDTPVARASYVAAVFLLAPIAIIVPVTISAAVGSNAIVGERERGTGEFLAHSPVTMAELYVGKLIASLVPGYLALIVGFSAYALIVNLTVGPDLGGWFFPTIGWVVRSAASAQQASSLVTLPVIMLSYAVSVSVVVAPGRSSFLIGAASWVVAILLSVRGAKKLRRERLLGVASET